MAAKQPNTTTIKTARLAVLRDTLEELEQLAGDPFATSAPADGAHASAREPYRDRWPPARPLERRDRCGLGTKIGWAVPVSGR
jgi:hypothetical protein